MRRLAVVPVLAIALVAPALAGCGQEKKPAAGTAAEVAPAKALLYAEVALDPKGSQEKALRSLAGRFPGSGDPGTRITTLLDDALRDSDSKVSFAKDIKPWLGDKAGAFASGLDSKGNPSSGAVVIQTDDEDAATKAVEKASPGTGRQREHRGKKFKVWRDGSAAAIVDGNLVAGNPAGVKAAIDADAGDGLDAAPDYRKAIASLPGDRLGFAYFNGKAYAGSAAFGNPALAPLRKFVSITSATSFGVTDDAVEVDATLPKEAVEATAALSGFVTGSGATDLVGDAPEGAWIAGGQPNFGKTLGTYVALAGASLGGRENVARAVRDATGLDLERDLLAWVGDVAYFVKGTSIDSLDGALVVETKDPQASARALRALRRVIVKEAGGQAAVGKLTAPGGGTGFTIRAGSELPQPVHVVQRGEKVAIAYGDAGVRDAFGTSGRLSDSQAYKDAESSLGDGYGLSSFVDPAPILQLAESAGATSDPDFAKVKPYLDALGPLVSGSKAEGDALSTRLRLNVK